VEHYPLFANRRGSEISPSGRLGIESFHLDHTVPVWMFAVGGRRIEGRISIEPRSAPPWISRLMLAADTFVFASPTTRRAE
jgi:hypothetical protein